MKKFLPIHVPPYILRLFLQKEFFRRPFFTTCLFFLACQMNAQLITVQGRVLDNSNSAPLQDATITVVSKGISTASGAGGKFSIKASKGEQLLVEHVGYAKTFVTADDSKEVVVQLNIVVQSLSDVVVVGYGTQKRKDLTGAISSIKLENSPLENLPNVNLLDALKGSMPGFDIGAVTNAGGNPSIKIRGQNSVRASNTPLVVVDGVVFIGSFNEINPMDIASVDILKDASSTAIYGSLAANGVILITTKRGKTEKPVIQLNMAEGFQTYTSRPHMLSPEGYIRLRKDRFLADNPGGTYDTSTNMAPYEFEAYKANHTVDWFDEVTRVAPLQNYGGSISGASGRSNYYISGSYMNQKGIVVGDQFHKFSIIGKIESRIADWLRIGLTLNAISKNADGIAADLRTGTIDGPYSYLTVHDRGSLSPGFENFTTQMERYPQGQTTTSNPLWNTQQYNEDRNQNYRSSSFARVDVPWIKGLSYTLNYSLNRWEGHYANFQDENFFVNTMLLNELKDRSLHLKEANGSKQNQNRTDWYLNNLFNYKRGFGDHSFDATVLFERQGQKTENLNISAKDFSGSGTTVLGDNSLEMGNPANYFLNTDFGELYQMAAMARLNYVYKDRYHASFSIRQDGYSGYAEGHKYGVFRAGAVAWTASEEQFVKDNFKFINNLKFRLTYGENGNPSVGAYATFPKINSSNTILLGGTSGRVVYAENLANKNIDWEKTTAFNVGLDFSIFNNILSGTLNFYNSNTTDLLLNRAIPIINGYSSVLDNIGKINNKGLEVQLNSKNYSTRVFSWSTGFNFWLNRNKVVSLYGLDANKDGKEDDDPANGLFIGKSLGANYTYVMDGIIQKNDAKYMAIYGGQPGDIKFKDLNGDGKVDGNDRTIVGYSKPNFTMTLSNTFTYKKIELYFLFNYIAGGGKNNYYIGNNDFAYFPNALYGGGAANWLDKPYWTPDNPSNSVTRINYNNSAYNYGFPKSREFLRLQDVALSYSVPSSILKNIRVSTAKVHISGKNLLTFSSWEGSDPESGTSFAGINGYPVFKIVEAGISLSF